MNNENLLDFRTMSEEEHRAIASAGGKASGVTRKRNATIRDSLQMLLRMDAGPGTPEETLEFLRASGVDKPTLAEAIAVAQACKAKRGDTEAARYVRDSSGELPTTKVELAGDPTKPIAGIDLTALSDEDLRRLADARSE